MLELEKCTVTSLSSNCYFVVIFLQYSTFILLHDSTVALLYEYSVIHAVKAAMLLHFYTMGFISTSQHFCPSQSLKIMMGPNVFSYTLS